MLVVSAMLVVSEMPVCPVEGFLTKKGERTWRKPSRRSGEVRFCQPTENRSLLIRVFLGLVRGVSGGQPEFAESLAERLPADAQERGGVALDSTGMLKDQRE